MAMSVTSAILVDDGDTVAGGADILHWCLHVLMHGDEAAGLAVGALGLVDGHG